MENSNNKSSPEGEKIQPNLEKEYREESQKLSRIWQLVLNQYGDYAMKIAKEEGEGIGLFNMKDAMDGDYNCEYFYDVKGGAIWINALKNSPDSTSILEKYNPKTMYMLCVQIPVHGEENLILGNIRLFKSDTREEIPL